MGGAGGAAPWVRSFRLWAELWADPEQPRQNFMVMPHGTKPKRKTSVARAHSG